MSEKLRFKAIISPIMSGIRTGNDGMRVSFDISESDVGAAVGLIALRNTVLELTISIAEKARPVSAGKQKGEYSAYWQEMFKRGFNNYPDLIEVLECAGDQVRLRLHDVFETASLSNVSPFDFEMWAESEQLHSLVTLSRQAQAKLAA